MLKNYLKIAWRNLIRNKSYTFINIFGLAVALASCLIIGLYIKHELSYDKFFPNAKRTYRIIRGTPNSGYALATPGLAHALASHFPEIDNVTVIQHAGKALFGLRDNHFYTSRVFHADSNFFNVFPYKLVSGNPGEALAGPRKMVITRSLAKKLFDDKNPVGKVINYDNKADYTITGVIDNPPTNVDFRPNALLSLTDGQRKRRYAGKVQWRFYSGYVYVTLN